MIPVLPVVVPLFAAALLAALTKIISQRVSQLIAFAGVSIALGAAVYLLHASAAQPIIYWFGNWRPRNGIALGISFTIEPLGAGLASFACLLMLAALVFSSEYFDTARNHFHALLLVFLAAMCGFCLTGDLFNMFVFFELMSAAAFALCAHKSDDPGSLQGALNFAVTNTIAAYFVLTGLGLLYSRTGALNMAQMARALGAGRLDALVLAGFVFMVCGYLVKAAVVPFHFWLADAHAVAPSPVCVLFSGVMVEMGLFALARCYWAVFQPVLHPHTRGVARLLLALGTITAVSGTAMCYIQRNLKRLLAFSTIGHAGLMLAGIGLLTADGLAGSAVYALGHGLVKGALFLCAGILLHRFEDLDEFDLNGIARREHATAAIFFCAAIGLAGSPLSGIAAGGELMHASAQAAGYGWLRWVEFFVGTVTAAAVLRSGGRIFYGWGVVGDKATGPRSKEKAETKSGHERTPKTMLFTAGALAIAGLFLGIVPHLASAASVAAGNFENTPRYVAWVLDGRMPPGGAVAGAVPFEPLEGIFSVLAAIAITGVQLFTPVLHRFFSAMRKPIHLLHSLHSGHIGDYVAFLTFGMATLGLICIYCFR